MDTDNAKTNLKRILSNPNTMTFLLVIILIVIVYLVYVYLVNKAIDPVKLPYANTLIKADEEITNEKISFVSVSGTFISAVSDTIIQNKQSILDHRVSEDYQIPKNSFFYKDAISEESKKEVLTDFHNLASENMTIYSLKVDFHSTYGNSIMPGNYIDLYFKAKTDDGEVIFAKWIESIQVYKVRDKNFVDVFSYSDEEDEDVLPKYMYFAVPDEYFNYLQIAERISTNEIEIIPVPRNAGYSETPKDTNMVNVMVQRFLDAKSVPIKQTTYN